MVIANNEQYLTVSCKLAVTDNQREKLEATLDGFCNVCRHINADVDPSVRNKLKLQSAIYHQLREQYPHVNSNLVIAALGRVAANRKSAHERKQQVKTFRPTSIDYNARTISFREKDWTVSLSLVGGRERLRLEIGEYQKKLLTGTEPTSATLVKRGNQYYINLQVKYLTSPPIAGEQIIGVKFGLETIAALSTGEVYSGSKLREVRDRYTRVRRSLQKKASKGTRTTRRNCRKVLKRLSRRERRFATGVNHNISTDIVKKAKENGAMLALEELTGVRERTNPEIKTKLMKRRLNSWSFYQLRQFIEYKARIAGVPIILVKGNEKQECFADVRGATDLLGATVNSPERSLLKAS
ncbi:MAG: IS200/IS605 family element transposase accessory protein TnpB [Symploca sp. SIO2C1]|nr:IS200/IS605 family element transposase accessory protein TnpB [Symploca sp. SIO2C1]